MSIEKFITFEKYAVLHVEQKIAEYDYDEVVKEIEEKRQEILEVENNPEFQKKQVMDLRRLERQRSSVHDIIQDVGQEIFEIELQLNGPGRASWKKRLEKVFPKKPKGAE